MNSTLFSPTLTVDREGYQLQVLCHSGHTPPLEEPERFTQILKAWA
ncbi:alpha/beta fold hydrolase [Photobacterium alginatilyticum]|nr:hypothetical protein [Photobacterium alginatilyticum]